jgi:hypothetical protein
MSPRIPVVAMAQLSEPGGLQVATKCFWVIQLQPGRPGGGRGQGWTPADSLL